MRPTYLMLSNRATLWISCPIVALIMVGIHILLFQCRYKAPTEICLTENVVIPARTELVLEGKLVKTTSADVVMITANHARAYEPVFTFHLL